MKHYHELPRKDDNKTGMLREPAMSGLEKDTGQLGWGAHVCPWPIHVDVWQNQYNIVKSLASN